MAFVDYYKILGVDKNIPQKDVRAAYRKRAKQFHPDLHPNDPKAKAKVRRYIVWGVEDGIVCASFLAGGCLVGWLFHVIFSALGVA